MLNSSSFRWASFALALGLGVTGALAPLATPVAQARSPDPVQLKLRQVTVVLMFSLLDWAQVVE